MSAISSDQTSANAGATLERAIIDAIASFASQHLVLHQWCRDLTDAQLDSTPVPGTWSPRQLLVHMLDSDLAASHRMRRIASEQSPLLIAFDETASAHVRPCERAT